MRKLLVILLCFSVLGAYTQENRIPVLRSDGTKTDIFFSGGNLAWDQFANDFGPGATNFEYFDEVFTAFENAGGNSMRLWVHINGANNPNFDENGACTGLEDSHIPDMRRVLDLAYNHNIVLVLSLWSFDMLNHRDYPAWVSEQGEKILTVESNIQAYIDNALIPMVEAFADHHAVGAWEIFNEPEGMSTEFGWSHTNHVPMSVIQRFVNRLAGAIHRTDPDALVTNGTWAMYANSDVITGNSIYKNYYDDEELIAVGGDPDGILDFYQVHYYDWMSNEISVMHHPADHWELDKAILVGEFFPEDAAGIEWETYYDYLYNNGYAGALTWQWAGEDGSTEPYRTNMIALMESIRGYPDIEIEVNRNHFPFISKIENGLFDINSSPVSNYVDLDDISSDIDGDELTFTVEDNTNPGLVSVSINAENQVTMSFASDQAGSATIAILATDPGGLTASTEFGVVVREAGTGNLALYRTEIYTLHNEDGSSVADPLYVTDGDYNTRWSSAYQDPAWIYIDLGGNYEINQVSLYWEVAYGQRYEIQVSDDASSWTTVYTENGSDGGTDDILFDPVNARYVRMYGVQRATEWGYSLYEFEVYGTGGGQEPIPLEGISLVPSSVKLNINGSYDIDVSYTPSNATNLNVTWSSDNESVATVNSLGLVNAIGLGNATITATSEDGSHTSTAEITVEPLSNERVMKVMPLGNSITQGDGYAAIEFVPGGYRLPLWQNLVDAGLNCGVDLVGTLSTNPAPGLDDTDHEGHSGWTTGQILAEIDNYMAANTPDIVMMHLGTNDAAQGIEDQVAENMRSLIDHICALLPVDGKLYVSTIIPFGGVGNETTLAVNDMITQAVSEKQTEGLPVYLVDAYSVMTNDDFTADWTHPNQQGYNKLGDFWFNVIRDDIRIDCGTDIPVVGVSLDRTTLSLVMGNYQQLNVTISPTYASNTSVSWESNDPGIASVDANGVVNAVSEGTAVITVTTEDGGFTASCTVNVTDEPTTSCGSYTSISLPFTHDGEGNYCWVTSGDIAYVNSWNLDQLEINGEDFTNVWGNNMPPKINGNYYIHYQSSVGWAHVEIDGTDDNPVITYELTTSVIGQGSVSPSSGSFEEGTDISISATPATGYEFAGWSGDLNGTSPSALLVMDSDKSVTATFTRIDEPVDYTLSVSTTGEGSVAPEGGVYPEGTVVSLTATPAQGYVFNGWSGDAGGTSATTSLTMDADKYVVANFVADNPPTDCDNPISISIPLVQTGAGEYCWVTSTEITYINSWGLEKLTINGVDYTNVWSNSLPAANADGEWEIHYAGAFGWSHFEAPAAKSAQSLTSAQHINIYPNPFSGEVNLDLSVVEKVQKIEIINALGQVVQVFNESSLSEGLNTLSIEEEGNLFIVRIHSENNLITKTITRK